MALIKKTTYLFKRVKRDIPFEVRDLNMHVMCTFVRVYALYKRINVMKDVYNYIEDKNDFGTCQPVPYFF